MSSFGDQLKAYSKRVREQVESVTPESIPFEELFTPAFMSGYTDAASFNGFLSAGGFDFSTKEAIDATDADKLSAYVQAHSQFASRGEMKVAAYEAWAKTRLAD